MILKHLVLAYNKLLIKVCQNDNIQKQTDKELDFNEDFAFSK